MLAARGGAGQLGFVTLKLGTPNRTSGGTCAVSFLSCFPLEPSAQEPT